MDKLAFRLAGDLQEELVKGILPFWIIKMVDNVNGGFYGQINGNNLLLKDSPKGSILNARILWTFSACFRQLKDPLYLSTATRAKEYIINHFFDRQFGGTYWSLKPNGDPLDTKKQVYSQAFFIYALSEYHLATGDEQSKELAINLYELIEKYSYDKKLGGYFEAYNREWQLLEDLRLSDKDANEKKTMNTHLHILEAYTNLYRIWKDKRLSEQLRNLILDFTERIIDKKTSHLNLFFDENWICKSALTSYGHDIECSWLLFEAAIELGDELLLKKVKHLCLTIVDAVGEGLQPDGSIIYEKDGSTGHTDMDRHWWPQAEAVVGFFNAYEVTSDVKYLNQAVKTFNFIRNNLIDQANGEWFWSIKTDGSVNLKDDKAGFWKCPYHNGRMCLEIIRRIEISK